MPSGDTAATVRGVDLGALPPVLTAEEVAPWLGIGTRQLWALCREGRCPVPVLRVGRAYRFPTAPLLRALGLDEGSPGE